MKKLILLCLFFSSPVCAREVTGQWFFYDLSLGEKFVLNFGKVTSRGKPQVSFEGALGGRYFSSNDQERQTYYAVTLGSDFSLVSIENNRTIMKGVVNDDFTSIKGEFFNGDPFIASRAKNSVWQVVFNGGEVGEEGAERCSKIRNVYENKKIKYSVNLACRRTGGVGGTRSQKTGSWNMSYRNRAANWLVSPNTFISQAQCEQVKQEILDKHKCWE